MGLLISYLYRYEIPFKSFMYLNTIYEIYAHRCVPIFKKKIGNSYMVMVFDVLYNIINTV